MQMAAENLKLKAETSNKDEEGTSETKKAMPFKYISSGRVIGHTTRAGTGRAFEASAETDTVPKLEFKVTSGTGPEVDLKKLPLIPGNARVTCRCGSCDDDLEDETGCLVDLQWLTTDGGGSVVTGTVRQRIQCSYGGFGSWVQTEYFQVPVACLSLVTPKKRKPKKHSNVGTEEGADKKRKI
jgi:hypothetical protein